MKPPKRIAPARSVAAGGEVIMTVPMLAHQAGSPPDLLITWNDMARAPGAIDIALHLHGYSDAGAAMNIATEKFRLSGLDFGDPDRLPGATPARTRPTLCILPRGRFFGGRSGHGYDFPALEAKGAVARLLLFARTRFAAAAGVRRPAVARRILTAHSGGGAAMMPVAAELVPHEIYVFDALYSETPALCRWVERAIAEDAAALHRSPRMSPAAYMARWGHALRVFYIPDTGTEAASRTVAAAIEHALHAAGRHGPVLAPWYRVDAVRIEHGLIPRTIGWQLLADPASHVA